MIGARNVKSGLVLLALSLGGGLLMSLYAFVPMVHVPDGLAHYDDLPRRLLRLAHVAGVMLPLLNVVLGLLLDRLRLPRRAKEGASWLLIAGAAGLPLALGLESGWSWARNAHVAGPPAVAGVLGVALVSWGALRTPAAQMVGRAPEDRESLPVFSGSGRIHDIESPRDHLPRTPADAPVRGGMGGHPRRRP